MNTADRVLGVLSLFTPSNSEWTVEGAAQTLNIPVSTTYRYFRSLVEAGLIINFSAGRYVVGPGVIELDRQTRHFDPLIQAAAPTLHKLVDGISHTAVSLLCRIYRLTVMCVDEASTRGRDFMVSYERGRPMPLLKGAASLSITAHLPTRTLKRYLETQTQSDLDWNSFLIRLRNIRSAGVCVTSGELDQGMVGLSAPVFDPDGNILASIGLVVRRADVTEVSEYALTNRVREAGQQVTQDLKVQWAGPLK